MLDRGHSAVCSLPKGNFQIPLLPFYDLCPLVGFGDNASGCCAQSVLFPKQKLSNSLAAAGWVVPSVPVGQMHFQDGSSLH